MSLKPKGPVIDALPQFFTAGYCACYAQNVESLLSKMKEANDLEYVLTVLAGAHITAPYVRPTCVHFYIKEKS